MGHKLTRLGGRNGRPVRGQLRSMPQTGYRQPAAVVEEAPAAVVEEAPAPPAKKIKKAKKK